MLENQFRPEKSFEAVIARTVAERGLSSTRDISPSNRLCRFLQYRKHFRRVVPICKRRRSRQ